MKVGASRPLCAAAVLLCALFHCLYAAGAEPDLSQRQQIEAWVGSIQERNDNTSKQAARKLIGLGELAVPALIDALRADDCPTFIAVLIAIGKPAVPHLIEALQNENHNI